MKNMAEILELPEHVLCEGDLGIEIEVEGTDLPRNVEGYRIDKDGSLKSDENAEYVFDKPRGVDAMRRNLGRLAQAYEDSGSEVDESVRAGVHVHVNVQRLNVIEVANFITIYLILEELLVKFCGPHREGNLFCLRSKDAEFFIHILTTAFQNRRLSSLHTDQIRYASMNLKAIHQYGSIEFRAMRGTKDLKLIGDWAELLMHIRDMSKNFKNPIEIMEWYSGNNLDTFLDRALGQWSDLFLADKDYEQIIKDGMRLAQDFAFCTDWDDLSQFYEGLRVRPGHKVKVPDDVWIVDEAVEDL